MAYAKSVVGTNDALPAILGPTVSSANLDVDYDSKLREDAQKLELHYAQKTIMQPPPTGRSHNRVIFCAHAERLCRLRMCAKDILCAL